MGSNPTCSLACAMAPLAISTLPVRALLSVGDDLNSGFSGSVCRYAQLPGSTASASRCTITSGESGAYLASSCADGAFGLACTPKPDRESRRTINSVAPIASTSQVGARLAQTRRRDALYCATRVAEPESWIVTGSDTGGVPQVRVPATLPSSVRAKLIPPSSQ